MSRRAPVSGVWISRRERAPLMRVTGLSESQQSGEAVEGHEPIAVSQGAESKDHGRGERRPCELQPQVRDGGRSRIGPLNDGSGLDLAAYPPGQHREKHRPPDNEI